MSAKFDPAERRRFWLEFGLQHRGHFDPETGPVEARVIRARVATNSLIDACFVGLTRHVRPRLEAIAHWMETQPPPDRHLISKAYDDPSGWESHAMWWQTLGLCKWLSRGQAVDKEFGKALDAEWNFWMAMGSAQAAEYQWERERELGGRLAVALAGNRPDFGLKLYKAANPQDPMPDELPILQFCLWACEHLAAGGKRDAEFVARGAEMLRASLMRDLLYSVEKCYPALWLKAIYWDSGMVRTPEQAIAKAYDSMPDIERPDFGPA